ncbi:MAG: type II toxin-antitoxin system VapC family toxin [Candidatus Marinimicrobia bacterium]|nr:type II toxin-antitoxin system VapC family toxin [Candidatus Neomarinimicrobiota bacterium]MCF7922308.1 type II toxin-antitoxin system VapC family toxin [Candidatus Neomarinimicrobiota bacterium]
MITLDTHIIIWDALQPEKISTRARKMIDQANELGEILIADISLWEIAMLMSKGHLVIDASYSEFIRLVRAANHYVFESITPEIADLSVSFSSEVNWDPADRLICATSVIKGAPLITADANLRASKMVKTIW